MRRILLLGVLAVWPFACQAQTFAIVQRHAGAWMCRGRVWVENSNLFCQDVATNEVSMHLIDGREVFSKLENPSIGRSTHIGALAEDPTGNIYVVDGVNVHVYSPEGKFQRNITPGINMAAGIAVLDAEHIYVSGRLSPKAGNSTATVFLLGKNGIERSFSSPFIAGLSGMDDRAMNSASVLALDRSRKLVYQVPQNSYEIRVFDLEGGLQRTISPPAEYQIRAPKLHHYTGGGVALEPSDAMDDISVLPDGGLAVTGEILDHSETVGKDTALSFSRFVDVYDADGTFRSRLLSDQLQPGGAHLLRFDGATGKAYFRDSNAIIEEQLR